MQKIYLITAKNPLIEFQMTDDGFVVAVKKDFSIITTFLCVKLILSTFFNDQRFSSFYTNLNQTTEMIDLRHQPKGVFDNLFKISRNYAGI